MISISSFFRKKTKGFTLVEVLVSLGIMVSIMSIVLSNQNTYTDAAALANTADEIGLALSQAQVYGVGVREFSPGSNNFEISYGLSFDDDYRDSYIFFADRNGDGKYNSGWSCPTDINSECISKQVITKGNTIDKICYIRTPDTRTCTVGGVNITFARPNTEAVVGFFNPSGQSLPTPNLKNAEITIKSLGGLTRKILIYPTGQISIQ